MPVRIPIPKRKITETINIKKSLKCEYIIKYWQESVIQTFWDTLLSSFQRYAHFLAEHGKQENNFQRNKKES
ncbi:hypothetical protein [Methanosarcina mazei]|uniref:hypothetical protein n=1 Tax=Methanosarcina mazei TaxID=2209 RepID=UPI00064F0737|nr:hypothetical protein [Methanosarcina mazei]